MYTDNNDVEVTDEINISGSYSRTYGVGICQSKNFNSYLCFDFVTGSSWLLIQNNSAKTIDAVYTETEDLICVKPLLNSFEVYTRENEIIYKRIVEWDNISNREQTDINIYNFIKPESPTGYSISHIFNAIDDSYTYFSGYEAFSVSEGSTVIYTNNGLNFSKNDWFVVNGSFNSTFGQYISPSVNLNFPSYGIYTTYYSKFSIPNGVTLLNGKFDSDVIYVNETETINKTFAKLYINGIRTPFRKYNPDTGAWERLDNFFGEE